MKTGKHLQDLTSPRGEWATVKNANKETGIPAPTIYSWLKQDKIPGATRLGSRYLIPREWIEKVNALGA